MCVALLTISSAESTKTVFDTLYTKWEHAPPVFCMDSGCNIHLYLLNRELAFFKDTKVLIDQAHFRGHTNCSPAY